MLIILSIYGCKKGGDKSTPTQTEINLKHKVDSIMSTLPKSININGDDSTAVIENKDGTIIRKKINIIQDIKTSSLKT